MWAAGGTRHFDLLNTIQALILRVTRYTERARRGQGPKLAAD